MPDTDLQTALVSMACRSYIPADLVVGRLRGILLASGGEDLQVEHPVLSRSLPTFYFHPTLTCIQSSALLGNEVIEVGQTSEKHHLAPAWMMQAFHGK